MIYTHRISWQAWFALLALALMVWLLISQAAVLLELSFVVLGAMLLALGIRPFADTLSHYHIPRAITTLLSYVFLLLVLVLVGNLLVPVIQAEVGQIQQNAPQLWQAAQTQLANTPFNQLLPSTDSITQNLGQQLDPLFTSAVGTVTGLGQLLLDGLVLLILAYFFSIDPGWNGRLLTWIPIPQQPRIAQILDRIQLRLTRWVWAQVVISLFFALTFGIGLALLHVPFALTIAVTSGVLGLIPYLGSLIALLLAVFSALTVSPALALWVIVLNLIVANAATHILTPWLYGRTMGLPAAWVLVLLLFGAKVAGIMGILFAVPVAVIVTAVLQEMQSINHKPVTEGTTPIINNE